MIITINQLIGAFKEFADNHVFLKDFGYGPTWEIGTTRQMEFPYMWVSHTPNSTISFQNRTAIPTLSFFCFMLDQRNDMEGDDINGLNSDNTGEVMSDTFQFIQDFITFLSIDMQQYGVMLQENLNVTPVYDETQDKAFGWFVEIDLKLKHVNCVIPWREDE
jgi:hypothetical protein